MLTPNTILQNRYVVVRAIGQGGMGAVYLAKDQRLGSDVALKETFFKDDRLRKAFEREARLLASLRHPALPKVIDHFSEGDGQFLVMEFIPGDDLLDLLNSKGTGFPPGQVLTWADQLLDALDYLHTQQPQIIHRDIKPQNLKLMARNQIVLLDFGLAKGTLPQMSRVTAGSSVLGYTPHYAPLEQMQGAGTDPRSDLYSLAATLYHLLTGYTPHDALARAAAVVDGEADPLVPANEVSPQVPPAVAAVLTRAMALKRDHRPATAADMRMALQNARRTVTIAGSGGTTEIAQPAQGGRGQAGQAAPTKPFVTQPLAALSPARTTLEATQGQATAHIEEDAKAPRVTKSRRARFIWLAAGLGVILLGFALALSGVFRGIISGGNTAPAQAQNPSPSTAQSDQSNPDPASSSDSSPITPFPPTPTEVQPTETPAPAEQPEKAEKPEKPEKPGNDSKGQEKGQEKPPPQINNGIDNFRVVNVSDTEILVKVDYTYTGDRGPDRIFLSAYPLPRIESGAASGYYPSPVKVGGGTASIRVRMSPRNGDFTSTSIQVCLYVGGGGTFFCRAFPYRKVWKPAAPEAGGCSNVDDAEITANVKDMLAKSRLAKRVLPRISVSTRGGVVTIRGTIASDRAKQEATRVAMQVACVKRVDNQLIVE